MSTVHVLPPSEVVSPLEVASFRARVLPKDESASFKMIVVEVYSASWDFLLVDV